MGFWLFPWCPGGFRELREACRNHFHQSRYLSGAVVTSYGRKPWGDFFHRLRYQSTIKHWWRKSRKMRCRLLSQRSNKKHLIWCSCKIGFAWQKWSVCRFPANNLWKHSLHRPTFEARACSYHLVSICVVSCTNTHKHIPYGNIPKNILMPMKATYIR